MIEETVLPVTCQGYDFALWVWDDYWQGQLMSREIIDQAKEEYLRDNPWACQFIS